MLRVIAAIACRVRAIGGRLRPMTRLLILSAAALLLVSGHAIFLRYVVSHTALSGAVLLGVIALVVIKHVGLFGPLYAVFRRRTRR